VRGVGSCGHGWTRGRFDGGSPGGPKQHDRQLFGQARPRTWRLRADRCFRGLGRDGWCGRLLCCKTNGGCMRQRRRTRSRRSCTGCCRPMRVTSSGFRETRSARRWRSRTRVRSASSPDSREAAILGRCRRRCHVRVPRRHSLPRSLSAARGFRRPTRGAVRPRGRVMSTCRARSDDRCRGSSDDNRRALVAALDMLARRRRCRRRMSQRFGDLSRS
jgi:hypothetical protein